MEAFMQRFEAAPDGSKNTEFFSVFNSMQKGERRRSDFLSKLSDKVKTISQRSAEQIALVCALAADQLVYDLMFVSIGEAGHALRILIRVASRLSDVGDRTAFLAKCMAEATDDTLAFRIQTALSKPGQDFDLGISFGQLYPSFVRRMRYRYGRDVDAQTIDLTYSDHHAFNLWGMSNLSKEGISADPEDRAIQRDFWLRYIGNSKSRLAFAFANFIMPNTLYEQDPTPFVENKIPVADLGELYNRVRDEPDLPEVEQASIRRLARFLDGEFKNGLSISQFEGRDN